MQYSLRLQQPLSTYLHHRANSMTLSKAGMTFILFGGIFECFVKQITVFLILVTD